jgi:hypothetical protein
MGALGCFDCRSPARFRLIGAKRHSIGQYQDRGTGLGCSKSLWSLLPRSLPVTDVISPPASRLLPSACVGTGCGAVMGFVA